MSDYHLELVAAAFAYLIAVNEDLLVVSPSNFGSPLFFDLFICPGRDRLCSATVNKHINNTDGREASRSNRDKN
jgi:hypothetical protein